jgi:hypothetical protein
VQWDPRIVHLAPASAHAWQQCTPLASLLGSCLFMFMFMVRPRAWPVYPLTVCATGALAACSRRYVWDIIQEAKAGRAIVLTTHRQVTGLRPGSAPRWVWRQCTPLALEAAYTAH